MFILETVIYLYYFKNNIDTFKESNIAIFYCQGLKSNRFKINLGSVCVWCFKP